jgi:hypothetical protein
MILSSVDEGLSRRTRRAHNQFSEFIKGPSTSQPQHTSTAFPEPPPTSPISSKRRGKQKATAAELESLDTPTTGVISTPSPRKKRRTITISIPGTSTETISPAHPNLNPSKRIPAQDHDRITRSSRSRAGPSAAGLPATHDLPPRSRKVILRVTEPEDALDQLLQRTSEPFPTSSIGPGGKLDDSLSKLEARVKAAAALAEKRAEFRRNGWYLPLDRNGERRRGPPEEPERPANAWDAILKAIEAAYRPDTPYLAVTRQICEAMKVRADPSLYGQATQGRLTRGMAKAKGSKKQRDDPETAWRKRLAKETVDLVVDQWKRVVLVSVTCALLNCSSSSIRTFQVCPREMEGRGGGGGEEARTGTSGRNLGPVEAYPPISTCQSLEGSPEVRTEASTRSQSRLTQGYSDDSDEAEEERKALEVGDSSGEDAEGHEEGTMALLNDSVPSSPPRDGRSTRNDRLSVPDILRQTTSISSPPPLLPLRQWISRTWSSSATRWAMGSSGPPTPGPRQRACGVISSPAEFPPDHRSQIIMNRIPGSSAHPAHLHLRWRTMWMMRSWYRTVGSSTTFGLMRLPRWTVGIRTRSSDLLPSYVDLCDRINGRGWNGLPTTIPNRLIVFSQMRWVNYHIPHGDRPADMHTQPPGLGKTIQTIALLAHLASDRGIWGPHLIIVPTSVILNWEMEFKKFLPGFRVLSYYGNPKRRKELRRGWNDKYHFNVCVTSYALALKDAQS